MNKPCLILDLDETVISTLTQKEINECKKSDSDDCKFLNENMGKLPKYDWHYDKIPPVKLNTNPGKESFVTFERPGLQDFLDFAFANFRVFIWTAGSPEYAAILTENIILRKNKESRELHGVFNSEHVVMAEDRFTNMKDLRLLWETFNASLPEKSQCTKLDTIILDDNELVYRPYESNCIYMKQLDFQKPRKASVDTFLQTVQKQLTVILQFRNDSINKEETAKFLVEATYGSVTGKELEIKAVESDLDNDAPLDVSVINKLNKMGLNDEEERYDEESDDEDSDDESV